MPPVLSKLKNKKIHGQTREVISNVLSFMSDEAANGSFIIPLEKCRERTAKATGVSLSTVKRVKQENNSIEAGQSTSFQTPDKTRNKLANITGLDDFDLALVRRIIHHFYIEEKRSPTVNGIRIKLADKINFRGGNSSVRKILKKLSFKWQKTKTNRRVLIEKSDIIEKRISYLKEMKKYRASNNPIVYVDETYILSTHVQNKSWSDDSSHGILKNISKGERLIIMHAGGEMGFIPNALLIWKASQTTGDYHHNVNKDNYKKWLEEILIPNLPPNSVVVLDNAPYHNVVVDKVPNSGSTKKDMKDWLVKNNLTFSDDMLKPTLYNIIKQNKPTYKIYEIDEILKKHNHIPLRLPPYHPDLNPIENVWAIVKGWVAARNTSNKIADVEKLTREKFSCMGVEDWAPFCRHVKKIEDEYWTSDGIVDNVVESLIITLGGPDSDDSDFDSDSDNDSDLSGIDEI